MGAIQFAGLPDDVKNLSATDRQEYQRLAQQAGVDPNSGEANQTILGIVASRTNDISGEQRTQLTADYLALKGASQDQIDQVLGTLRDNTILPQVEQADASGANIPEIVVTGSTPTDQTALEKYGHVLVGAGNIFQSVGDAIDNNPLAKYTLLGLDVASGPALYVARQALDASPVGDFKRGLEAEAAGYVAGGLADVGYTQSESAIGGGGALGLAELALGGAVAAARTVGKLFSSIRSKGYQATFGTASTTNYRKTFLDANPDIDPSKVVVHHAVEQQTLKLYPNEVSPEEIYSLENLRGVPTEVNSELHLRTIRNELDDFYLANPNATKADLLQKATEIDRKYGAQFTPPVGGGG